MGDTVSRLVEFSGSDWGAEEFEGGCPPTDLLGEGEAPDTLQLQASCGPPACSCE